MDYRTILQTFAKQLSYDPIVTNRKALKPYNRVIICGMGGSRLAADLLKIIHPEISVHVHSDYGLPTMPAEELNQALIIANSHSGATAETIDAAQTALAKGLNLAAVTAGGTLGDWATQHRVPNVQTPDHDLPARTAIGYNLAALMELLGLDRGPLKSLAPDASLEAKGKNLAAIFADAVPLIYVPTGLMGLGYVWKITLNETAKVPAFCNRYPELGHNEIAGFDASSQPLYQSMKVLCISAPGDDRLNKKAGAIAQVLQQQGIPVTMLELSGASVTEQILNSALLAHWTALSLAESKGVDPVSVPVIEELKKATV